MKFPELTLTPVNSKLHDLTLYEPIDVEILNKLINSDLLKDNFRNPTANFLYSNEREQLINYKKLISLGKAKIVYKRCNNMDFGRCNPLRALGLFCIRREIRQTLCKNKYIDLDIENCHPAILLQICKKYTDEIESYDNLEDYVNNRASHLKNVMDTYKVDRDTAKRLFIILLYYGSFETWANDAGIDVNETPATKDIKNLRKELLSIGKVIYEKNKLISAQVKKNKDDKQINEYNEIGSVVSYYLQEIECRILEQLFIYCKSKNLIPGDNVCVLCADGLMIMKEHYYNNLLKEFNQLIKEKFGLDLVFTTKEMTQDYLEILDDHILTEEVIIKRQLEGYDMELPETYKHFEINKMTELFNKDIEELGAEKYFNFFSWTRSFKYFNNNHAYFTETDNVYKIDKLINKISKYESFNTSYDNLQFVLNKQKHKFTTLFRESNYIKRYSSFHFEPNYKISNDKYNLFYGFTYSTDDNKTYDYELIKDFIRHVEYVCNEEDKEDKPVSDYFLNWISHIFQKPEIKTNVAVVLYSITEGIGKNTITDILAKLLKGYETKFRDTNALTDKFNGDMMAKLFVVGDEINARAQQVANELKDIITRKTENIEFKGKDKFILNDYKNYIFTTNNENVFKVSNTDRRYMFIECPETKKTVEYYKNLINFSNDETKLKHLFNFFYSRDISEFQTQNIVMTDYKKRIIMANLPPYIKFLKEYYDALSGREITTKELYDESLYYAKNNMMTSTYTLHSFEIQFKKVFGCFNYKNKDNASRYKFPKDAKNKIDKLIEDSFIMC